LFDMKPDAPEAFRGQYHPISTSVPGLSVCEHLPNVARLMHKVTLLRGVHHTMKNHNSASYYALTGHAPPLDDIRLRDSLDLFPAYGSVVDRLVGHVDAMPGFVAFPHVIRDGAVTPGQHASFLGKAHDPLLVTLDPNAPDFRLPELSLPADVSVERLAQRQAIRELINQQADLEMISEKAAGISAHRARAVEMLTSPKLARAFQLNDEPESIRERYGRTTYGQSCLLARRLVESGVRFVNVYFSESIGGQSTTRGGWDTHGFNNTRMFPILKAHHLPLTDQTLPALVNDLDERGLLDETLVVWMGEFGRTPRINDNASRDHWPTCYSVILAGGGVGRGLVYGSSDRVGAYPSRDAVPLEDLAATIFSLVGVDPTTELRDRANRPLAVSAGSPVSAVMAG
jgi:hypothetical protein